MENINYINENDFSFNLNKEFQNKGNIQPINNLLNHIQKKEKSKTL